MHLVFPILILFIYCQSAILESVFVRSVATSTKLVELTQNTIETISISSIQEEFEIQVTLCPSTSRVTLQCTIQNFNNEVEEISKTISSSECQQVHLGSFQDGKAYWTPTQGLYQLTLFVESEQARYSIAVTNPTGLQLQTDEPITNSATIEKSSIQQSGISLVSSTIQPISIRWFIDSNEFQSSESTIWKDNQSISEGKHYILAFVYDKQYDSPAYSISRIITVISQEIPPTDPIEPTIPPRLAPTVPPVQDQTSHYCGDEKCDSSESCNSCPLDCGLCEDYSCSTTYCTLPSCQCAVTHHPSNFALNETPQFVTITWDDAQTPTTFSHVMSVARSSSARDAFGCNPKMTFFTQTNDNQYQYTKQLYLEGHEVAIHTVQHSTNTNTPKSTWEREILKAREYISKYSNIPEKDIVGFRAPDLKYNDELFTVLQERGFLYDSSIPFDVTTPETYFPYTLDFGAQEQQWKTKGVTSPHPGLWEFALPTLVDKSFTVITIQDPSGSKEEIIQLLKDNFDLHYNTNRSPFVIGLTASWLLQNEQERLDILKTVLSYIASKPNIIFASMKDIIHYFQSPVKFSEMKASDYQCVQTTEVPIASLCDGKEINTCYYSTRNFQTCEQCPDYYPGEEPDASTIGEITPVNQWNGLFSTVDEQSWDGGFCTGISITNKSNRPATDFELVLSTRNIQITTLWGLVIDSTGIGKYVLKPDRQVVIKPGNSYSSAGICGMTNSNYSLSGSVVLREDTYIVS